MGVDKVLEPYIEDNPRILELNDGQQRRLSLMVGQVDETVGIDHLVTCLAENTSMAGDGVIRCYVGFEPSGKAHIGLESTLVTAATNVGCRCKCIDLLSGLARVGERQIQWCHGRHSNNCHLHGGNLQSPA